MKQTHYHTCNLCEAMCGIEIEHRGDEILAIRGDKDDPFSRGHICPKAVALQDLHHDPDRLRHPVKRTADGWVPISWDEALDETARRLHNIQEVHGKDSVALYFGNPTAHNHGALFTLLPFVKALRSRQRYSATSADQLPHQLATWQLFGHQALFPIPDVDRTDYFLIIGGNPLASNGSIMTVPDVKGRLKALQKRGGKVVVVDPRRTETAKMADEHHFVRPGTDVYLLLAIAQVLFEELLVAPGKLEPILDGKKDLARLVVNWTPEKVAETVGMTAGAIRKLARDIAAAPRAAIYSRVGVTTSAHSTLSAWLVYLINILTGNLDREGGVMFTNPAFDIVALGALSGDTGSFDRYRSRVHGYPEFGGEFPVTTLADEMLTPGKGQVKAFVSHAGNPVLSCPDGRKLDKALGQLDFMVSIDFYINETTRHADIILPPTGQLEHAQFDPIFQAVAVRNVVKFTPPLVAKPEGSLHDWEILNGLTTRLNRLRARDRRTRLQITATDRFLRKLGDRGLVDLGLRLGPYGTAGKVLDDLRRDGLHSLPTVAWKVLKGQRKGLTLKKLLAEPHGIDLGPLEPMLPERLYTRDQRINLVPALYFRALQGLPAPRPVAPDQMLMIGRRHIRSNNSWMHNSQRLVKGKGRCNVMIHPEDAERLAVADGDDLVVSTPSGTLTLPAWVCDDIMPGVISVPHGWGHDREGVKLGVARRVAGQSVNDIIGSNRVEAVTAMAQLNGIPVTVEPAKAPKRRKKAG
ncbi:dehydrogenase [Alcanivorax sp. HI0033]|uniref:molybdopterin-dependent oxidoreductase n=1 Tax=unclassified Alcanivorax TaxID=2638842 RepID=UPI0007B9905A|nr:MULTISPECIES: molybdopterin-dependent oxidoreductase [unclassified Alcanivorax]KZX77575.1 dehydrogenase [Alcanivorax sp. HI0013]KZX84362.1 dehydrogenase [Alcanivorax sp. HI0011]KZY19967.1 dehydrogenase [Alcanivorax sp. HI0035]KZX66277.1 dehydrogenase [Alcanivorax sp. HI0007]KZX70760.1 dehydrogenase [Alcanivorax sp. HI0003]